MPIEPPPRTETLIASDGVRIACDLYGEGSPRPKGGVVVLAPGFWRRRASPVMRRLAEHLAARGRGVLLFDFRGHGRSSGAYTFGLEEGRDFAAVLECAGRAFPEAVIHAVGFSLGGSIAMRVLAREPRAKTLVTVCAPADFAQIKMPLLKAPTALSCLSLHEAVRPPRVSLRAYLAKKPRYADCAAQLAPVALHVFHTQNDWLVGVEHAHLLYEAASEPKSLRIFPFEEPLHADALLRRRFEAFCEALEGAIG